jgi:hypothetical protein
MLTTANQTLQCWVASFPLLLNADAVAMMTSRLMIFFDLVAQLVKGAG